MEPTTEKKAAGSGELVATRDEVERALIALTKNELRNLKSCACRRALALGSDPRADAEGLLQDVIEQVLRGASESQISQTTGKLLKRRWNPARVSFPRFLFSAIRSLVSNETRHLEKSGWRGPWFEVEESMASVDPRKRIIATERLQEFRASFSRDAEALSVIDDVLYGLTFVEISLKLGISKEQFRTIKRRIDRRAEVFYGR